MLVSNRVPTAFVRIERALLLLVGCCLSSAPAAAGGYFSGIKGARAAGRAGAFAARADDLAALWLNPAGLAHADATRLVLGNRISHHGSRFVRQPTLDWGSVRGGIPPYVTFDEVKNGQPWQALDPLLGVTSNFGLPDWGFGLAAYAPAGVARQRFPIGGGQRYMMVQRDARILEYALGAAHRPNERLSIGLSLRWLFVERLTYELVIDAIQFPGEVNPVESELDMLANVSGSDPFTPQLGVGAWYRAAPFLDLGLAAQVIPTRIHTDSRLSITPLSPAVDDDVLLLRDGERANDVRLSLPLPLTLTLGARYRHLDGAREVFDLELDLTYESWSRVDRFRLDGDGLTATLLAQTVDVGAIQIEKRWRDTLSARLGGDYAAIEGLFTLRGGAFYDTAVSTPGYAHVDFTSGAELGATFGATVSLGNLEISLAHEYRTQPVRRVSEGEARVLQETPASTCPAPFTDPDLCHPEYLGRGSPPVNAGSYETRSHSTSVELHYRF